MEKVKKVLGIASIATLGICVVLLILGLFGVIKPFDKEKIFLYILLSAAVLCAGSFFSMNALSFGKVNKILSYVTLALIGLTVVGALVIFLSKFGVGEAFSKVVATVGIVTVIFVIICGTYIKLGSNYKALQIVTYALVALIVIVLIIEIYGGKLFEIDNFTKIFVAVCVVALALLGITNIVAKRVQNVGAKEVVSNNSEYISIKKVDYDNLIERVKELEEKLKKYE